MPTPSISGQIRDNEFYTVAVHAGVIKVSISSLGRAIAAGLRKPQFSRERE